MTRDQAKQEIKRRYADYLQPAKKHGTYICPLCKNGTGSTGDGITVKPGTTHLKCFKCSFGGDLIDTLKIVNEKAYNSVLKKLT